MKQKGFTLIELMIALLIGVFLLIGLMNLFISTNRSVTLSDAMSQNQETGRFTMDYITRYLRSAGYQENFSVQSFPEVFVTSAGIDCAGAQAIACALNDDPNIRGDRLAVAFLSSEDNVMTTCAGTAVGGGGPGTGNEVIVNLFWVNLDPGDPSDKELRCQGYNHTTENWVDDNPVALIRNIEAFHFQVGLATANNEKSASRYVPVDQVDDTELIRSIKIAVLTTSEDNTNQRAIQTNIQERKYAVLDADEITVTDGQLRQIFSSTVELPNAIANAALVN